MFSLSVLVFSLFLLELRLEASAHKSPKLQPIRIQAKETGGSREDHHTFFYMPHQLNNLMDFSSSVGRMDGTAIDFTLCKCRLKVGLRAKPEIYFYTSFSFCSSANGHLDCL